MAIKQVSGRRKKVVKKKGKRSGKKAARSTGKSLGLSLPTKPKKIDRNLNHYKILIYGREKIGKTTIFSTFPDAMFLSTEPGTKGLEIFDFNEENGGVTDWDILREAIDLLEKTDRFEFVIIDTVDRAYEKCLTWWCQQNGIDYPGVDRNGKEDFGKSWRGIRDEFTFQIDRIINSGRGVGFTSHAKEVETKPKNAEPYHRIYPTMSNQARKVIEPLVDMFFFADYVKDDKGKTNRILICEGDEAIWAGARAGVTKSFPALLPMDEEEGYNIIRDAFMGKISGLDPRTLQPTKRTSKSARKLINRAKAQKTKKSLSKRRK